MDGTCHIATDNSWPSLVVVPFALEAAVCVLCVKKPGTAMPGVATPAIGLSYPSLKPTALSKTLVVCGRSSSVGTMTTQIATAAGLSVIAIAGASDFDLCKASGAAVVFDYHDPLVVDKVIAAVLQSGQHFVGVFDAISTPESYKSDPSILASLNGGHLACTHPPPIEIPNNVTAGMIFAVDDIATPVWKDYVTAVMQAGNLNLFVLRPS
jgi:NADPH:quinone reductase-like Zn-dependent oxidoreductase